MKKRTISRCTSRKHKEAKNLLRSSQRSKEGEKEKIQNHIGQIPEQPALSKITNRHRMGRRFLRSAERSRNEHSWKLAPNTSGKNGPMDPRDDYQEGKRTHERLYEEHGKGNTRLHPKDQVRQRRSQQFTGTEEGSERDGPKRYGGGTTIHQQVFHPQVGKQLHGGNPLHGIHVIVLAQCSVACLVSVSHMHDMCMWLNGLTAHVTMECCVRKTFAFTLSAPWHTVTFSHDSANIEHFSTSHPHSNPPFDQTINETSA